MLSDAEKIAQRLQELALEATSLAASMRLPDKRSMNDDSIFNFSMQKEGGSDVGQNEVELQSKPPLPSALYLKAILKARAARSAFFETELFADPAWDMILDLALARVEGRRISVTSLCSASGVPHTTALRWISQMVEDGIFVRTEDDQDKRRALITLSDEAAAKAARYFQHIQRAAV